MQVFITNYDPRDTVKDLDNRRLNKQILEVVQILCANNNIDKIWKIPPYIKRHPTSRLWYGHNEYLLFYLQCCQDEYLNRTNKLHGTHELFYDLCSIIGIYQFRNVIEIPPFINDDFINSMREKLYNKDSNYYSDFPPIKHYDYIENYNGMTESEYRSYQAEQRGFYGI